VANVAFPSALASQARLTCTRGSALGPRAPGNRHAAYVDWDAA